MKKILILLLLVVGGLATKAQVAPYGKAYVFPTIAGDTLTNVDTVAKVIPATAGYSVLGIQVNANVLSGSLAGKAYIYQSLDGYNYTLTDSVAYSATPTFTSTIYPAGISPTYTNVATFQKTTSPSVYYLVEARSTTTVSAPVQILYTARPYYVTKP
jgi:hypothetical protein